MRSARILTAVAMLSALAGCAGQPLPLSAQAGSSILIPLTGSPALIGYGTTDPDVVVDRQRGRLIFRLDGPTGLELTTRGVLAMQTAPGSLLSRESFGSQVSPVGVFVVLDIPADAPEGPHSLHITRVRVVDGLEETLTAPSYPGQIMILPASVTVDLPGGGTMDVIGAPTPAKRPCCPWEDLSGLVHLTAPSPQLQIAIVPPRHSVELEVAYPPAVIDVVDAYQTLRWSAPLNDRGLVWFDDDASGTVRVSAASANGDTPIDRISLAFELDPETSSALQASDSGVVLLKATDEVGNDVTGTTTVSIAGIQ